MVSLEDFRNELRKQLQATNTLKVALVEEQKGLPKGETLEDEVEDRPKQEIEGYQHTKPVVLYYSQIDLPGDTVTWYNDKQGKLPTHTAYFYRRSIPELLGIKYAISKLLSQLE